MSRFPHKVLDDQFHVGFKESPEFVIEDRKHDNINVHQSISFGGFVINDNMADPTSKSTFPQGAADKVASGFAIPEEVTVKKNSSRITSISGSKGAPILVPESSPKAILNSPKASNVSKDFHLRQAELASKSDELYNKLINKAQQPAIGSQFGNNLDNYIDL